MGLVSTNPRTESSKKHELKSKQKLEKKLSFYTKVKDAVSTLNADKTISKKKKQRSCSRQKKLKAYDLSLLGEFLPETTVSEQKAEAKLNCKSRQALPPDAAKKDAAAKHAMDSKDKKRRKKRNASSGTQSMEI